MNRLHGVVHLELGVIEEAGSGGEVRSRTVDAEQIWEIRDGDTEVGGRLVAPLLTERDSTATGDVHGCEKVIMAESRREADDVGRSVGAVNGHHAVGHDSFDRGTDEIDVRTLQAPQP